MLCFRILVSTKSNSITACTKRERESEKNMKPTVIITNVDWVDRLACKCDGSHKHGKPLRGKRAKLAAAYPVRFCDSFAEAVHGRI